MLLPCCARGVPTVGVSGRADGQDSTANQRHCQQTRPVPSGRSPVRCTHCWASLSTGVRQAQPPTRQPALKPRPSAAVTPHAMMDAFFKFRQGDHDLQPKAITTHGGQGTATKTETICPAPQPSSGRRCPTLPANRPDPKATAGKPTGPKH
jgi:hypothetical protein